MRRATVSFHVSLAVLVWASVTCGQLRIVDFNTTGGPRAGMDVVLRAMGDEIVGGIAKPIDVLALQEQESSATTTDALVTLLHGIYGANTYARATLNADTWGSGRPGLIYNTQSVTLLQQIAVGELSSSGQVRQFTRYKLRPLGYDSSADFYVYSNHYKAGITPTDMDRRNVEAATLRANSDALGEGAHIIYAGDFNIRSSTEPSYQTLLATGNGQAVDPIHAPGTWHSNLSAKVVHTQAPSVNPPEPLFGGGMDDRFDFQLVSGELLDGEGLSYVSGSYHAFGNNGTHALNGSITTGSGAAAPVLSTLANISDHLPVVADYQLPAKMQVTLEDVPESVLLGARVDVDVTIENAAPVAAVSGADELDYQISGTGGVIGTASGTDEALGGGNVHVLSLNTGSAGLMAGQIDVSSTSQSVANGIYRQNVSWSVFDHAQGSFDGMTNMFAMVMDFGYVPRGSPLSSMSASLFNRVSTPGMTAALDVDAVAGSGDVQALTTDLAPFAGLEAGGERPFSIFLDASAAGYFSATYLIALSDEDLPGAVSGAPLSLELAGFVFVPGDMDVDTDIDFDDIDDLVQGLNDPEGYAGTHGGVPASLHGDMDDDGDLDFDDIPPFVNLLVSGSWHGGPQAVPEPACGLLAALAGSAVVSWFIRRDVRHPAPRALGTADRFS
jgi:endonuclease/exonuclease/phosphatase family metal-dependent hydrolase